MHGSEGRSVPPRSRYHSHPGPDVPRGTGRLQCALACAGVGGARIRVQLVRVRRAPDGPRDPRKSPGHGASASSTQLMGREEHLQARGISEHAGITWKSGSATRLAYFTAAYPGPLRATIRPGSALAAGPNRKRMIDWYCSTWNLAGAESQMHACDQCTPCDLERPTWPSLSEARAEVCLGLIDRVCDPRSVQAGRSTAAPVGGLTRMFGLLLRATTRGVLPAADVAPLVARPEASRPGHRVNGLLA